jgi:23S rRNA (guanine2445-N2)-methyltransferase / 23S rRNA (guanine2069-N7)-methyltransferase
MSRFPRPGSRARQRATAEYFATCPRGAESLLVVEMKSVGAADVQAARAGVAFSGGLEMAYRACLWSRTASRVLMPLVSFDAADGDALYEGAMAVDWAQHVRNDGTVAVDAVWDGSVVRNSHFAEIRVKDAIVDRLRAETGIRPSVRLDRPDVRVNALLRKGRVQLAIDLSGESLHRRGYREPGVQTVASLKEHLAATMLLFAGWPSIAAAGGSFLDPLCGSGTLPIEAALMAGDIAPGLMRTYFGMLGWLGHDAQLWDRLLRDARNRAERGRDYIPAIAGTDRDPRAVTLAREAVARAGLGDLVTIEQRELSEVTPPRPRDLSTGPACKWTAGSADETQACPPAGLVCTDPPYGVRLGRQEELGGLYAQFGDLLRSRFGGWRAAVLSADAGLEKRIGLGRGETHQLSNGPIACRLTIAEVRSDVSSPEPAPARDVRPAAHTVLEAAASLGVTISGSGSGAEMFSNRLRKDLRHLSKWARREGVECWRVYDEDMPEYKVAVDLYVDVEGHRFAHVAEYEAPSSIEPGAASRRLAEAVAAIPAVLDVAAENVFLKVRRRQRGASQYERQSRNGVEIFVREGSARFLVNLSDFLDTGLFLDHRLTRGMLGRLAEGRDALNLFSYTGSATVAAGLGGATSTTSVDMSATYLAWAERNLVLNGLSGGLRTHELVRADCLEWLAEAVRGTRKWGLIFLDPPTFSNSKRMGERTFDVQRDHVDLLRSAASLLADDGVLVFSTNARRFKLDARALEGLAVEDITASTIPPDFARHPGVHGCWRVTRG